MMDKILNLIPKIVIILLPIFFSINLDLLPYSKTTQQIWERINISHYAVNTEKWMQNAQSILRQQPWQANLWFRLAEKQYANGNYEEAIQSINESQLIEPLNVKRSIWLGHVYWEANQLDLAYSTWQSVVEMADATPTDLQSLVQIQQSKNDWYGAYTSLLKWKDLDPNNKEITRPLVFSEIIFEPEKAIETIHAAYHVNLQTLIPELQKIIEETNPVYQLVLSGNLLSSIGEWEYAKAAYVYATRMDPDYAEAWALYGNALMNTGDDGYIALNKALEISPQSILGQAFMASYWRGKNDFDQSLKIYQTLSEMEPSNPVWQQELANTYIMSGDLDNALQAFIRTTKIQPGNSSNWISLARFSGEFRIEIQEVGIPAARQAILIDENNWEAYDSLGWLYLLLEDYTSAQRFLFDAYKKSPQSALVNLHLGQLFYFQSKTDLSKYFLMRSLEYTDDEEIIKLTQKFLNP